MTEQSKLPSLEQLETLIGYRVRYLDQVWVIIEILEEELAIVLQRADQESQRVLSNAQGEPVRELPEIITINVRDEDGQGRNPVLDSLEVLDPPESGGD